MNRTSTMVEPGVDGPVLLGVAQRPPVERRDRRGRSDGSYVSRMSSGTISASRRAEVRGRRRDRRAEVVLGRHVRDRVVQEHGVEPLVQPQRAHVADDVPAARVDRLALREHPLGEIGERHLVVLLEVQRVGAAAAAELEHRADRDAGCARWKAAVEDPASSS